VVEPEDDEPEEDPEDDEPDEDDPEDDEPEEEPEDDEPDEDDPEEELEDEDAAVPLSVTLVGCAVRLPGLPLKPKAMEAPGWTAPL
jgi:hypothetical protein